MKDGRGSANGEPGVMRCAGSGIFAVNIHRNDVALALLSMSHRVRDVADQIRANTLVKFASESV